METKKNGRWMLWGFVLALVLALGAYAASPTASTDGGRGSGGGSNTSSLLQDEVPSSQTATQSAVPGKWYHNVFGYNAGWLIYDKWLEPKKAVHMNVVTSTFEMACTAHRPLPAHVGGSAKVTIKVVAAYNPAVRWEKEFHREVALWDSGKNEVDAAAVRKGVDTTLQQYRDRLCLEAGKKSLSELVQDGVLPPMSGAPYIEVFGSQLKKDETEWDIRLHSVTAHIDADSTMRIVAAALKPVPPIQTKPAPKRTSGPVVKMAPVTVTPPPCGCK